MEEKRIQVVQLIIDEIKWFVCLEYNIILFLIYIQIMISLKQGLNLIFDILNLVFLINLVF